jgi:hypothetical protein
MVLSIIDRPSGLGIVYSPSARIIIIQERMDCAHMRFVEPSVAQ